MKRVNICFGYRDNREISYDSSGTHCKGICFAEEVSGP